MRADVHAARICRAEGGLIEHDCCIGACRGACSDNTSTNTLQCDAKAGEVTWVQGHCLVCVCHLLQV